MPARINAAHRLDSILREAAHLPEATSTVEVWTQVFNITGSDAQTAAVKVAHMIGLMREQVNDILSKMSDTSISSERYEPQLKQVSNALDVQNLSVKWQVRKQNLTPEVLSAVGWCADTLPGEEEPVEKAELENLKNDIQNFRTSTNEGSLPDYAKSFVLRQLDIIEQAIQEYPVVGAKAFRHASVECFFELSENRDTYLEHSESEEMNKLQELWGRIQHIAEKAGPWMAIGHAAAKIAEIMDG